MVNVNVKLRLSLTLWLLRLHPVHLQHRLDISVWNDISERVQQSHYHPEPPFVMQLQFTICLSEFEVLLKKRLDVGMLGDAARANNTTP